MPKKHRNGRVTTATSVEDEIVHLRGLDLKGLRARWQGVLQKPAPDHLPRHLSGQPQYPSCTRKSRQGFPRRLVPLRCVCVEVCCAERCSNVAVPACHWTHSGLDGALLERCQFVGPNEPR
jgi:hypothetical protein